MAETMTPDEFTIAETFIDVGDGHKLYVQDWGNKEARLPILFLHGGPGVGVKNKYRQQFEPKIQRVIFFDQRGSGKSLPKGSLKENTTSKLVEDIEKIADSLKLEQFIITGGSWGSCLALAYSLKHPKRIHAMVLRGIFTGSKSEIEWLDKGRFETFFPDVWQKFESSVPASHSSTPTAYHFKMALGGDKLEAKKSAYAYENLEGALLSLDDRYTPEDFDEYDPSGIRIEIHYLVNDCFMPDRYILNNAHKLKMPIWLIQGRYDMVCPPKTAYRLHQKLPNSELIWATAGHTNDRPIYDANRTILLQMTRS